MKYLLILAALFLCNPVNAATTSTITSNGTTYTFSQPVTYGQFILGDYWILDPGEGVTVSMSPSPTAGKDGCMVNPRSDYQAYDSRGGYYNPALLFSSGGKIKTGDSLICARSEITVGDDKDVLGRVVADEHSVVNAASVITVLSSAPSSTAFRPPYFGTTKPIYDYAEVDVAQFKNYTAAASAPSHWPNKSLTLAQQYADYFKRPWIIHGHDYLGRYIHPLDNMPNYYEYCYDIYSEAGVMINSDLPGKTEILKGLIQLGIDTKWTTNAGYGDRTVSKFPMLVAGLALNDPSLYSTSYAYFKEQLQTYYGTGWQTPAPSVLWRQKVGNEHENTHPSGWGTIAVAAGTGSKMETYRRCCSSNSWTGMALAIRMMGAETAWNHTAFLDYVDRWHSERGAVDATNTAVIQANYDSATWTTTPWDDGGSGWAESQWDTDMWDTWRDNLSGAPTPTCETNPALCAEAECQPAGWHWCDGECQADECHVEPPPVTGKDGRFMIGGTAKIDRSGTAIISK